MENQLTKKMNKMPITSYDDGMSPKLNPSLKPSLFNLIFSPHGRMNRIQFSIIYFGSFFIYLLTFAVIFYFAENLENTESTLGIILGLIIIILFPILFWINIVSQIKRLHDTNKSGWHYLVSFIPVIGPIILLVLLYMPGTNEVNSYGSKP